MTKQLLIDYTLFDVSPTAINESMAANNGKVIVTGVLQRAGAKNQNGRIYPKEILVEILTTPSGNILRQLMQHGVKLGISSRGLGSVSNMAEGALEVQDDFELVCWDFVSNPSTHGAFMHKVNESVSRVHTSVIDDLMGDIICTLTGACSVSACGCDNTCGTH